MPSYRIPAADVRFLLADVLRLPDHADLPGFADLAPDTVDAILSASGRFCEEVLLPLNLSGDAEGCLRQADGSVTTPTGFRKAFAEYRAQGWMGLSTDPDHGGSGLPYLMTVVLNEFASSANMAFATYTGLTQGAIATLARHGSDAQKAAYLPKMVDGAWTGTMNLTEPHCGTDLGLIRMKAVPRDDGTFALTGTKIFISGGEHDLAENIVHLVLARIEGAPEGTRGISMFVVPKHLPGPDGEPGARNAVSCGSLEDKMGLHASATCVMNYDGAIGSLVGEPGAGLRTMFTMMNEARLGVAVQGLAISEIAGQNAALWARERLQGRAITGAAAPERPADPIIVHADVRRMLMTIRATTEAGRALLLWTALQSDIAARSPDPKTAARAGDMLGLLTPVVKGVLTDRGFENAVTAQQVFGGHGYITASGMEQFVRDARVAMIYEGANGIQALDLVGRKLPKDGGRAIMAVLAELGLAIAAARDDETLAPLAAALARGVQDLQAATMWFMANAMKKPDNAAAGATDYMHLFGLVAFGWMWLKMARAATEHLAAGEGDRAFYEAKILTARFFMERLLPETALRRTRIESGAAATMALPADLF
ncbi:acyl-CoA dehydrogenase C-terminal domain-containing protein [Methylobrevis pamukkalensis]|uniref:3-methylmercaptopropionyl-CoA dehydrogenase n=1 Tax=Methylobrevis pamukkalensis TaxID=1439726 RepID=A0A1E3H7N7_9HYPH|nr:acyl-CoA dehydrogenase C-terminal domain-containing protein [Methylobrevis pamukkalensis]ODN72330.1 Acyl-CoA dehydrogenase [Methylobrevis pamukkalensis]